MTRWVCTSDTHNLLEYLNVPDGDVLLHSGDLTVDGTKEEYLKFVDDFTRLPHPYKIFIAGNHDIFLADHKPDNLPEGITYLEDSFIVLDGIKIYGSPWSLPWANMAFNKNEEELRAVYARIPEDTGILLTHGPPKLIRDTVLRGILPPESVGSFSLVERITSLPKLRYHIFGHIHEQFGISKIDDVVFINAAAGNRLNGPIVFNT